MKRFFFGLTAGMIFATALPAAAQPAPAAPSQRICLDNQDVQSATSRDGKTMIFKMRNGQTYINHLRGSCPGLRFNGFIWELRGINDICENQQTLRVIGSGEVCMLGKFDPPLPPGANHPRRNRVKDRARKAHPGDQPGSPAAPSIHAPFRLRAAQSGNRLAGAGSLEHIGANIRSVFGADRRAVRDRRL